MMLFLFEVIRTKPSGRTEFLGAFLVVRVNDFHARMIRLSMYFVGSRNGDGGRDRGLINAKFVQNFSSSTRDWNNTHNSKELSESLSKKEIRTFLLIDIVIRDKTMVSGGEG